METTDVRHHNWQIFFKVYIDIDQWYQTLKGWLRLYRHPQNADLAHPT